MLSPSCAKKILKHTLSMKTQTLTNESVFLGTHRVQTLLLQLNRKNKSVQRPTAWMQQAQAGTEDPPPALACPRSGVPFSGPLGLSHCHCLWGREGRSGLG